MISKYVIIFRIYSIDRENSLTDLKPLWRMDVVSKFSLRKTVHIPFHVFIFIENCHGCDLEFSPDHSNY